MSLRQSTPIYNRAATLQMSKLLTTVLVVENILFKGKCAGKNPASEYNFLGHGVTVAQKTLTLLVGVRIPMTQPI